MKLWEEIRAFLMGCAIVGMMWFASTPFDKPDWVLPLDESIRMIEVAVENHAYTIEWLEINDPQYFPQYGSIEFNERWVEVYKSVKWWMENR